MKGGADGYDGMVVWKMVWWCGGEEWVIVVVRSG